MTGQTFLRFADLKARGIVPNRTTLLRWQRSLNFPRGFMIGPNRRVWADDEIEAWIANRAAASTLLTQAAVE